MGGIEQMLTQNIASVVMAGGFIYYLIVKDKSTQKTFSEFNEALKSFNRTLTNHLAHQLKAELQLTKAFVVLSDLIKQLILEEKRK
jgi:hypothetical protein